MNYLLTPAVAAVWICWAAGGSAAPSGSFGGSWATDAAAPGESLARMLQSARDGSGAADKFDPQLFLPREPLDIRTHEKLRPSQQAVLRVSGEASGAAASDGTLRLTRLMTLAQRDKLIWQAVGPPNTAAKRPTVDAGMIQKVPLPAGLPLLMLAVSCLAVVRRSKTGS